VSSSTDRPPRLGVISASDEYALSIHQQLRDVETEQELVLTAKANRVAESLSSFFNLPILNTKLS
jgi:hypothetical protein